jgi:hypothetical protein
MDIPNARKKKLYSKLHCVTYTVYTVYRSLCPNGDTWKGKSQPHKQGEE